MEPIFIIEKDCHDIKNYTKIGEIANSKGCEVHIIESINTEFPERHNKFGKSPVVVLGNKNMVLDIYRESWFLPAVWFDYEAFQVSEYTKSLALEYFCQNPYAFISSAHLDKFKAFGDLVFVKPNSPISNEISKIYCPNMGNPYHDDNKDLEPFKVLVAPIIKIFQEVRCIVHNGVIITHSPYNNHSDCYELPELAHIIAEEMSDILSEISVEVPLFVMDLVLTDDKWKLLEINCINCSGFYSCNLQAITEAMIKQSKIDFEEIFNG